MLPFKYIRRSLFQRKNSTFAALGGSALVVVVFSAALMIPRGIERVSNQSMHKDMAVIMSTGATTETESSLTEESARTAMSAKEVVREGNGQPAASSEIVTTVLMEKSGASSGKGGGAHSNEVLVRVRGVSERGLALRPELKVVAGRLPAPGTDEAMVGRALRGHFKGLDIGQSVELKRGRPIQIVGVFDANGSLDESEVFADANVVRTALGREGTFSSIRVKVPASQFGSFKASIESQKRLAAEVRSESEFVSAQYGPQQLMMMALGLSVSFFFGLGGVIGALITMHSAVANRNREIGTLRALGFSRWTILSCIVIESTLLTFLGGLVGAGLSLAVGQLEISVINVLTLSEMVFRLQATPRILATAVGFGVFLGLFGGVVPAIRASRVKPIEALRKG